MKKDKNRFAGISALLRMINPTWADRSRIGTAAPRIRPLLLLSFGLLFWSVAAIAQTPTLGAYPSASVTAGRNTTVTPSAAPSNTVRATAIANPSFTGVLTVSPVTGVVAVTDAKQAGTYMVTVTAFNSGGNTATATFVLTVTNPACSAGGFTGGGDVAVGSVQISMAVGDFNGDGKQDLAAAEYKNAGTVAIRLGDGSGGFTGTTSVAVGNFPTSVAVGDFNGDGKLDFAAANKNSSNVSIRLGNGSGLFTISTDVAVGSEPEFVAVGDFNGDGKQDLVVANTTSDNVSIRLGDGTGGFSGTTNMATGDLPRSIAIDDFNGDGKQDLAVVNGNSRNVSIHLGNGMGGFTNNGTVSVGVQPYSVAAGDFNGDGKQDLLVANSISDNVSVLLGNGSGGFTSGTDVAVGDDPQSVAVGDFNGDGKQDFATVNRIFAGIVAIRLGNGTGGFTNGTNVAAGSYPSFVAVGDFNGDDKQDFATASIGSNNAFSVYLGVANEINLRGNGENIADADHTPSTSDHTDFGANTGTPITRTFTIQNTGMEALNLATGAITISGPDASLFSVSNITLPAAISGPSGSIAFDVTYTPSASGVHTATVNIASDDCDETTYDFAIKGERTCETPAFTACPTATVELNTPSNGCAATATYNVAANGTPAPALTYTFAGATTGSGNGTGSGSTFNRGNTIVTVTATNTCGAPTCVFNVTVVDMENPSIVCPDNIVRGTDAGQCTAVVTYAPPTSADNCSFTLTLTSPANTASGSTFAKGATMVNWKATDPSGNIAVCDFTVTVNDAQAPNISCPTNIVRSTDAGLCSAVATYATPTYSDNCTGAGLDHISGGLSGSTFLKGVSSVIWQATDAAGLTQRCTFTVTVNDNQLPTITCPGHLTRSTDPGQCSAAVAYAAPTASDNCTASPTVTIHSGLPSGSVFPKGVSTVAWKATDEAGLTKTCTFRVTVNDTQAPSITCPSSQTVYTSGGSCASAALTYSVTASDNCSTPAPALTRVSGPASGSAFPKGVTNVVWRATDASANTKSCSFVVTVTDNVAPTMNCPGNISVTAPPGQCNAQVIYTTPTATDNCELLSLYLQSGQASYSDFPQGVTTNIWRATDDSGVTKTCVFTVTVACGAGPSGAVETDRETMKGTSASQLGLILTPNPATAQVIIAVEGVDGHTSELTVRDAQGRTVWQAMLEADQNVPSRSIALDLSGRNFSEGLYFVTLRSDGSTMTKRLVKAE